MLNQFKISVLALGLLITSISYAQLPDPTRPPNYQQNTTTTGESKLRLSSILIGPQRRIAVINDQTLKVGDSIMDYKIIKIEAKAVTLKQADDSTITLPLLDMPIKQQIFHH
jgi:MSHA biogenesis protein MshK